MSLKVGVREIDGVSILDLSGRITLGDDSSGKLREAALEVLDGGSKKIILNLGGVSYVDSSGLGSVVSVYTTASHRGATVKLVNLQAKIQDLLQITKLYTVFEAFDNEAEAVQSFA